MLLRTDLEQLLAADRSPAVSIFLPTHSAGREVRQDAIRLRNLLNEAGGRLAAAMRPPEAAALLAPARELVDDEEFWKYQEQGLAIFLAEGFHRIHKLPVAAPEELFIGGHFHIKPLLPIVESAGWFWVLTISAARTRLFQGSRWTFAEAVGIDLPQGVAAIRNESDYGETHYAAPTDRRQRGAGAGLSYAQSFGDAPEELRKTQLIELLQRVAAAVEPAIKRQPAPVILAATPEIEGNFRERAAWKELLPHGIKENPDALPLDELHRKAWALIEPGQEKLRRDELGRLESLLGTGNERATTKPEEIVKAARYGRVDRLFLRQGGEHMWGRFDEDRDRVVAHGSAAAGDDDLLDYAAVMTLRQGGSVTLADRAQLPREVPVAAILRY